MARMVEMLSDHLCAVAAIDPGEDTWNGIPAVPLSDSLRYRERWVASKLRLETHFFAAPVRRAMKELGAEVALCNYLNFAVELRSVWERTTVPLWIHCHGYDLIWEHRLNRHFVRSGRDYLSRALDLAARARFIANSRWSRQQLVDAGFPEERIAVKYFGAPSLPRPPAAVEETSPFRLLYLGRLVDFKGPLQTIQAFERLLARGVTATLDIAGGGALLEECRHAVDTSPAKSHIRFHDWVSPGEAAELRARSHVFTAHSCMGETTGQEEAFGVSFVEAMAAGLPVVTGRSGGIPESVVDGLSGFLFEPGDIDAHTEYMYRLATDQDLLNRMRFQAWRHASDSFTLEQERERLLELLASDVV